MLRLVRGIHRGFCIVLVGTQWTSVLLFSLLPAAHALLSLPGQVVIENLLLWGWEIFGRADKQGSDPVQSSMVLELLAAEGHRPPHEWCEPAFRLLYKNMVTHGHPQDIVRYFRLMHAMGYRPPDHAWWDRFLQFHFYKQHAASREADGAGMMTQEMEQIRQAVAAVMAAPPV